MNTSVELSIVIPGLNEADTIETCLAEVQRFLRELSVKAEIIVADNGSSDGSQTIADRMGARIIAVKTKSYGNALMGGIEATRG